MMVTMWGVCSLRQSQRGVRQKYNILQFIHKCIVKFHNMYNKINASYVYMIDLSVLTRHTMYVK